MKRQGNTLNHPNAIGTVVFSNKFAPTINPSIKSQAMAFVHQRQWSLLLNQQLLKILASIEQASCIKLDVICINKNQLNQTPIIKSISGIFFTSLIHLNLDSTGIKNIESLSFLQMETLEYLELERNLITCVKSISKTSWRGLNKLSIHSNKLTVLDLSRTRMRRQNQILSFDFFRPEIQLQDGCGLMKVDFDKPVNLQYHMSKNSIVNEKVRVKIMEKMGIKEEQDQ